MILLLLWNALEKSFDLTLTFLPLTSWITKSVIFSEKFFKVDNATCFPLNSPGI